MKTVIVVVEGSTEQIFVKQVLASHFSKKNIFLKPVSLVGIGGFGKVKDFVKKSLTGKNYVTTMIDLYALPEDFPEYEKAKREKDIYKKVKLLEKGLAKKIPNERFIPYIQLHEFETLLFSSNDGFDKPTVSEGEKKKIEKIIHDNPNPETINDNPQTAPSKRLEKIYKYKKTSDGIIAAKKIGLPVMRKKCKHFNEWITRIENL